MSNDMNSNKDKATVEALAENELLLAEKSGNRVDIANTYMSEIIEKKRLQEKEEEEKVLKDTLAMQELQKVLDRLDEIAGRMNEIIDEIHNIDKNIQEIDKRIEALGKLKALHGSGKINLDSPEHLLLLQQSGVSAEDYKNRGIEALNEKEAEYKADKDGLHTEKEKLLNEYAELDSEYKRRVKNLDGNNPEINTHKAEYLERLNTINKKAEAKGIVVEEAMDEFRIKNDGKSALFNEGHADVRGDEFTSVLKGAFNSKVSSANDPFAEKSNKPLWTGSP